MSSYISFNLPYPFLQFLATIIKYVIMIMKDDSKLSYCFIQFLISKSLNIKPYIIIILCFTIIYYLVILDNLLKIQVR